MTKVTVTQFSFNRGELSPALHGRSDWKYYASGAETLRNLIVRAQGGATKRGGLRLVAPALDGGSPSFLVPFRFSAAQSYMLEFGDRKMRILRKGGVVVYPFGDDNAGEEVVVETPYPPSALPLLRYAQTADVMILTHPDFPPQRLSRHAHHDWRLERLHAGDRTPAPRELRVTASGGDNAQYVVTATSVAHGESAPTASVIAAAQNGIAPPPANATYAELYEWLRQRDASRLPPGSSVQAMRGEDIAAALLAAGYATQNTSMNGATYQWTFRRPGETAPATITWTAASYPSLIAEYSHAIDKGWVAGNKAALWNAVNDYVADRNAGLAGTHKTTLSWRRTSGAETYRIYRDRFGNGAGPFFLIGETDAAEFTDNNLPSLTSRLPEELDLLGSANDYPGVCAFFEQRLVLGRSNHKPTTFWGSETGAYNSFIRHTPILDSDSYEFTLASGEMNEIHWIVPLNEMLLGTSGGEWKAGGGGGAITPSNINARIQSWYGCAPLPPLVAGRTVLFAGRAGKTLRSFSYSLEADGYTGADLTAYASHLFAGRHIVSLCHQREPAGLVWVVLSDGALLSCTFAPEEDVVAWSRHETAGRFETCGSIADADGTDQAYFCVAREVGGTTKRFIEMLEPAADHLTGTEGAGVGSTGAEGLFLDCALTYSGPPADRVTGLEHLEGERVSVLADGCVFENLPVAGGAVTLPGGFAAGVIHAGLPYAAELATLDLEPEAGETLRNRARFAVSAALRLVATRECWFGHSDGQLSELKFRTTELPGEATRLFTGEKSLVFATPPGARTARMRFVSPSPVAFTVLGIVAEAGCGQPA